LLEFTIHQHYFSFINFPQESRIFKKGVSPSPWRERGIKGVRVITDFNF